MRYLGLDYGEKTVGTALSDELFMTAQPFETIVREEENKLRKTLRRIEEICAEKEVTKIVLGLPLHMDGTESERSEKTRAFRDTLERRTGLPVVFQEEQLTTVEADSILEEMGVPKKDRKTYIDKIAASVILEEYMNREKKNGRTDRI